MIYNFLKIYNIPLFITYMFSNFHFFFFFFNLSLSFFFLSSFFISFFLFPYLFPFLLRGCIVRTPMATPVSCTRLHPHGHHHPAVEAETRKGCRPLPLPRPTSHTSSATLPPSQSLRMRNEAVGGNGGLTGGTRRPRL
jgi:hypothetical protein